MYPAQQLAVFDPCGEVDWGNPVLAEGALDDVPAACWRPKHDKVDEVCSMEVKKNVLGAIAAAVHLYMQAEQQVVAPFEDQQATWLPGTAHSPWLIAGRQSAMDMRRLWQMRLVR